MSATRNAMDAEEEVSADGVASCTQDQAPTQEQAMQVPVPEVDSSMEEEMPAVNVPSCSPASVHGIAASYTPLHIPRTPDTQMTPPGKPSICGQIPGQLAGQNYGKEEEPLLEPPPEKHRRPPAGKQYNKMTEKLRPPRGGNSILPGDIPEPIDARPLGFWNNSYHHHP